MRYNNKDTGGCINAIDFLIKVYEGKEDLMTKNTKARNAVRFLMENWRDDKGKRFCRLLFDILDNMSSSSEPQPEKNDELMDLLNKGKEALKIMEKAEKISFSR